MSTVPSRCKSHSAEQVLLPLAAERGLPIALKVGAARGANRALRAGGDGVEVSDLRFLWRLCAAYPHGLLEYYYTTAQPTRTQPNQHNPAHPSSCIVQLLQPPTHYLWRLCAAYPQGALQGRLPPLAPPTLVISLALARLSPSRGAERDRAQK